MNKDKNVIADHELSELIAGSFMVHEKPVPKLAPYSRSRKEGSYYAKIAAIALLLNCGLFVWQGINYLNMPSPNYFTTGYKGEIRSLIPDVVKPRG